jgi:hypothetical protein
MAGRNDAAIAQALTAMAHALAQSNAALAAQQGQQGGADEQRLDRFIRNKPPTFKGMHDPEGAQDWMQEIERIFRAMDCTDAQRVRLGTHMLIGEAGDWWDNARQRLEVAGTMITWAIFKGEFLGKYFPEDVRVRKEVEFLELKQGDMTVVEYAAKFGVLIKFSPYYNVVDAEISKCIKFENGLRPEVKQFIGCQRIRRFADLVDASRIYDQDSRARNNYYKAASEKRNAGQNRNKPYDNQERGQKDKQKFADKREQSGGGDSNPLRCFRCGEIGHRVAECQETTSKCFRCGKSGHMANECRSSTVTCFRCGEPGHTRPQCGQSKKGPDATSTKGKVFALTGEEPNTPGNFRGRKYFF